MEEDLGLQKREVWSGNYRDVPYEIFKWWNLYSMKSLPNWTHYIYLWNFQFPESMQNQIKPDIHYTHFGLRISPTREWAESLEFNGGCTYYRVDTVHEYGYLLKIGCDYQHYEDIGKDYTLEDIQKKCIKTIDSLYKIVPNIVSVCSWEAKNRDILFKDADPKIDEYDYLGNVKESSK